MVAFTGRLLSSTTIVKHFFRQSVNFFKSLHELQGPLPIEFID